MSSLPLAYYDANGALRNLAYSVDGSGNFVLYHADAAVLAQLQATLAVADATVVTALGGNLKVTPATGASFSVPNPFNEFTSGTGVTVVTSLTTIIAVDCRGLSYMGIEIQNTGSAALSGFQVQARYNSGLGGFYNPKAGTTGSTDYTTNTGQSAGNSKIPVIAASGDLRTLAAAASGWLELDVTRFENVRFQAQVASGTTNLKIDGFVQ